MNSKNVEKLKAIMDDSGAQQEEKKVAHRTATTQEELHEANFKQVRQEIIRPVLEEIALIIKERGHACDVSEEDLYKDSQGRTRLSLITLDVYPSVVSKPEYSSREHPHVSFVRNFSGSKMIMHVSTIMAGRGGEAGLEGEFEVSSVTKEMVETKVVAALQKIFSNT